MGLQVREASQITHKPGQNTTGNRATTIHINKVDNLNNNNLGYQDNHHSSSHKDLQGGSQGDPKGDPQGDSKDNSSRSISYIR